MAQRKGWTSAAVWSALLLVLLTTCFTAVDSATFVARGDCPEGKQPGESWDIEGCGQCTCATSFRGYNCMTCGVGVIELKQPQCYNTYESPDAQYPTCCKLVQRCPGDAAYDPEKASDKDSQ